MLGKCKNTLIRFYRDLLSAFGLGAKKINTILGKEDLTDLERLNELLSEEEILGESKGSNQKLNEFLTKPENLKQLIHYSTRMPKNVNSKDQAYKFPFVCADILSNSTKLADALFIVKPAEESESDSEPQDSHNETVATSATNEKEDSNITNAGVSAEDDSADPESKAIQKVLQKVR